MLTISTTPLLPTALSLPAAQGVLLADGSAAGGSILGNPMIMMIMMFAVIYFIVLRPMSKQEKDRKKRIEGLKKGDQVVLQGGMLGRITNVDDPKVAVVELADRVRVRVLKSKIDDLQDSVLKAEKDAPAKKDEAKKDEAKKDEAKEAAKKPDKDPPKKGEAKKNEVSEADELADEAEGDDKDVRKGA
jgi:preprotein translocase subunit YajC